MQKSDGISNHNSRQDSYQQYSDISERLQEDHALLNEGHALIFTPSLQQLNFNAALAQGKQSFINTDQYVRKYSLLSQVLEKRQNPLLNNKGRIEPKVLLDESIFSIPPGCQCDQIIQSKSRLNLQECEFCLQKRRQQKQGAGGYVTKAERPTRRELVQQQIHQETSFGGNLLLRNNTGRVHISVNNLSPIPQLDDINLPGDLVMSGTPNRLGGGRAFGRMSQGRELSAQQGIERDEVQNCRLDLKSHLSKSMDSQHMSKHLKKMEKDGAEKYFIAQKSGSHYLNVDGQISDDDGEELEPLGQAQLNAKLNIQNSEEEDGASEQAEVVKKIKGKKRGMRLGGVSPQGLHSGGGSLIINEKVLRGHKKRLKKAEEENALKKLGSKEKFNKINNRFAGKNKNKSPMNKDLMAVNGQPQQPVGGGLPLLVETGQSPPSGQVRVIGGATGGPLPGQPGFSLNLKIAQVQGKATAAMQAMQNPFMMRPAFHNQTPDNTNNSKSGGAKESSSYHGINYDQLQSPDPRNPGAKRSDGTANLDLTNQRNQPKKQRPLSHSSNNSLQIAAGANGAPHHNQHHPGGVGAGDSDQKYQSRDSINSSVNLKSCLMSADRRSSRKLLLSRGNLDSARVKFHESVGKYSEEDEEHKHYSNRRKYKKFPGQNQAGADGKDQPPKNPDIKIMINMRRFVKEVNIKGNDPLVCYPYFKYFLMDQVEKKKYLNDIEISKHYVISQRKTMLLNPKVVQVLQGQLVKAVKLQQQVIVNFKDIKEVKNAIKMTVKKTIVFDMDNTIMTIMYKKNEIQEYDAATYVKLFGHSALKIYLNYRPYLKEMLSELKKNDFELVLFSSHNAKYLEQVAATLQKDEPLFDHLINKEHLHFDRDLDLHILDLNILLQGRELKDIIVVSNTVCRHLLQYQNGVPVKDYSGNKRDLSLYALTKYLKSFRDIKDVRTKIAEDFGL